MALWVIPRTGTSQVFLDSWVNVSSHTGNQTQVSCLESECGNCTTGQLLSQAFESFIQSWYRVWGCCVGFSTVILSWNMLNFFNCDSHGGIITLWVFKGWVKLMMSQAHFIKCFYPFTWLVHRAETRGKILHDLMVHSLTSWIYFHSVAWQMLWWDEVWTAASLWRMQWRSTGVQVCTETSQNSKR